MVHVETEGAGSQWQNLQFWSKPVARGFTSFTRQTGSSHLQKLPVIRQWPLHNGSRRQRDTICIFIHLALPLPLLCFCEQSICLPDAAMKGGKLNKYVYKEAHDLSRCRRNMSRCWHLGTSSLCVHVCVCVFYGLSTRKSCSGQWKRSRKKSDRGLDFLFLHIILYRCDFNATAVL